MIAVRPIRLLLALRFIKTRAANLAGLFLLTLVSSGVMAQAELGVDETDTRAIMKANFLFHFAASNEWPADPVAADFHIAVIGNPRLHQELVDKYALKMIGALPLKIDAYDGIDAFLQRPVGQVVYCEPGAGELLRVAEMLRDKPVLLVADSEDALASGALINFVVIGNRIRYEINAQQAREKGVLIGNKIMSWAVKNSP